MLDDDGTLMFRCGLESKSLVASLELLENDNESDTNTVLYLKNTKIIIKATKRNTGVGVVNLIQNKKTSLGCTD